jgi:hypothetical protein
VGVEDAAGADRHTCLDDRVRTHDDVAGDLASLVDDGGGVDLGHGISPRDR